MESYPSRGTPSVSCSGSSRPEPSAPPVPGRRVGLREALSGYSRDRPGHPPYVLHWDGSRWTTASSPHLSSTYNFLQTAVAVSPGDVWAAGYRTVNGRDVTFVEHWDGARWRVDRTPNLQGEGNQLYGLSVDPGGGLWAAGTSTQTTSA